MKFIPVLREHKIREVCGIGLVRAVIVCAVMVNLVSLHAQQTPEFEVWPQQTLPVNGRIVLTGPSSAKDGMTVGQIGVIVVEDTPERGNIFRDIDLRDARLISKVDTIPLSVDPVSYWEDMPTVQAILSPERRPTPGIKYRLSATRLTPELEGREWLIRDEIDTIAPSWNGPPTYIGGCDRTDVSHYAYLALPLDPNETVAIQIEVIKDHYDSRADSYILFPRKEIVEEFSDAILVSDEVILQLDPAMNGQRVSVPDHLILPIGNGIYGGSIEYDELWEQWDTYYVTISAIDAAGNRSQQSYKGTIRSSNRSPVVESTPAPEGSGTDSPTTGLNIYPGGIQLKEVHAPSGISIPIFERDD